MVNKILVVDDEWNMRNLIRIQLLNEGLNIEEASSGCEALKKVQQSTFNLIILDIMMPEIDGWEVCSKIRQTEQVPILMLTARIDIEDRVRGLNLGADDYLIKPFAPEELVARVHALLRRQNINQLNNNKNNSIITYANLSINNNAREINVNDALLEFTPKEFDLFHYLISEPNRVFTREILLDTIWSYNDYRDPRTVDTHVKNIREKLRKAGLSFDPIKTVWGVGYKFSHPDDQA